jgi:hypothetical protein
MLTLKKKKKFLQVSKKMCNAPLIKKKVVGKKNIAARNNLGTIKTKTDLIHSKPQILHITISVFLFSIAALCFFLNQKTI